TVTIAATLVRTGIANRRNKAKGVVPAISLHIRVTAATGDIVRPAAAAIATTAPTPAGSTCAMCAGSTKNPNKLCVVALPDLLRSAKHKGKPPATGRRSAGQAATVAPI